jgi:hypothetical protein
METMRLLFNMFSLHSSCNLTLYKTVIDGMQCKIFFIMYAHPSSAFHPHILIAFPIISILHTKIQYNNTNANTKHNKIV